MMSNAVKIGNDGQNRQLTVYTDPSHYFILRDEVSEDGAWPIREFRFVLSGGAIREPN